MIRWLGRSGIQVSAIGLGCWTIGGFSSSGKMPLSWGEVNDRESIRAIHFALDMGVNFFDAADVYGAGHSERVLGQALAGRRDKAVVSTKFGIGYDEKTRQVGEVFASPEYIRQACDHSLERLNSDYIDLYLFHVNWFPVSEIRPVIETLEELVKAGKIRAYGWSTDDPSRARAMALGAHCAAVMFLLNALDDDPEMIQLCQSMDLAGINRSPLALGLLTGKYRADTEIGDNDVRGRWGPDWVKYFKNGHPKQDWIKRVESIREILTSDGRTLAQGALSWIWARSPLMIPIPGFRSVKQVEENAGAMQFGPLHQDQMEEIERLLMKRNMQRFARFLHINQLIKMISKIG